MPNKTCSAESDFVTSPLQAPANIDIIAGFAKDWIEFLLIGHITSPFLILFTYMGVVLVLSIALYLGIEKPGRFMVQSLWGKISRTRDVIVPQQIPS